MRAIPCPQMCLLASLVSLVAACGDSDAPEETGGEFCLGCAPSPIILLDIEHNERRIVPGDVKRYRLEIWNIGEGTLVVDGISLEESRDDEHREFELAYAWWSEGEVRIGRDEGALLWVIYRPIDDVSDRAQVTVRSNDPINPSYTVSVEPELE